ncbi:YgfZ/GcvT domain-containing protein [Moraxella equi]|uniref:Folate-binding Fe/S cluster repair protein n=1 Tax=Moraxella equi TaxID=60442 RepID=A0A378QU04_9GAMM|nr:folate-binding Fe/S cluster repair protein [Moraxella equi]OPH40103.1 folate-binding Fe/S cluster repair protein [Moraxella equi]STZ03902.1 tRNA-modifying protein ygfZ [Moraxella equi]
MSQFSQITLNGKDTAKFLQGQLTVNVDKLTHDFLPCAISDLKGRVAFGLWVSRTDDETFVLITSADCMDNLTVHIKKYGAFSKFSQSAPTPIYPIVANGVPTFDNDENLADFGVWAKASIETGNVWITQATAGLFQPQELRLHQRGGVDYDKGCYLGQEIIARLYFKASPKAYLHRVRLPKPVQDGDKVGKVQIVNGVVHDDGFDALVIGSPEHVVEIGEILPLPDNLMGDVGRAK